MTWQGFYLVCFLLGFAITALSALGIFSHVHIGHFHLHLGKAGHVRGGGGKAGASPINGFTLAAFLCWFGGCGYLLSRYGVFVMPLVLAFAIMTGLAGASVIFWFWPGSLCRTNTN